MSNFEELKATCKERWNTVMDLKKKLDNDIIRSDVRLLIEKMGDFDNPEPDKYVNSSMEIMIDTNNGVLKIIDKKNNLYPWNFEITHVDFNLRMCDIFIHGKEHYSVSLMNKTDKVELLNGIEKIISEYDDTIKYFNENDVLTHKYKHRYFSYRESKRCEDIFEVYKAVIDHEVNERRTQDGIDWDTYRKTPYGHTYESGEITIMAEYDERWIPGLIEAYFRTFLEKEFGNI